MNIFSAIQYRPRLAKCAADVRDNFRRCAGLVDRAAALGSNLMVFPELAFTGYSFLSIEEAAMAAEPWDGQTFKSMKSVAFELGCYVAWGYVETDGVKLYNSATVVAPSGETVCKYRKVNLFGNDFLWAEPGMFAPQVAQTEFGTLSVIICRDVKAKIPDNIPRTASSAPFFPHDKPDVVAACTNWGKGGFPSTSWMDFVANNGCTMVVANRYGIEDNGSFQFDFGQGGSAVIGPDWKVCTSGLEFGRDCVVTAAMEPNPGVVR